MTVSITDLIQSLRNDTAWQKVPIVLSDEDYHELIVKAIKRLFIDTGRASVYRDEFIVDDGTDAYLDYSIEIDEEAYILIIAKINFFQRVQTDVNTIVSYSTDALSITNADKPYAHIQDTISELEKERRIIYYKMSRYNLL